MMSEWGHPDERLFLDHPRERLYLDHPNEQLYDAIIESLVNWEDGLRPPWPKIGALLDAVVSEGEVGEMLTFAGVLAHYANEIAEAAGRRYPLLAWRMPAGDLEGRGPGTGPQVAFSEIGGTND